MLAIVMAVLAGLCWGVGEIFTKKALNTGQVGPMAVLLVRTVTTLPMAAAAYWVSMDVWKWERPGWATNATPQVWLMLTLGSGLLAGFAGVFFFYMGLASPGGDISRIRPIAFALSPATAVLLGWVMLGEGMSLRKGIACLLIISGIVLLTGEKSSAHAHGPKPIDSADHSPS
ncbi:MAG: EamA family transporter [Phycisphaerae bacterium]|jgi:uncharacterized membrane protein